MACLPLALWLAVPLAAGPATGGTALVRPKMGFTEALAPYAGFPYSLEGYVGADGKVHGGGLGCSAFTSVVLHRMRDGGDWLRGGRYDLKVHEWYGDRAARYFGLQRVGVFAPGDLLDIGRTGALVRVGKLAAGRLYYFNARKGKHGHVGFVRVGSGGALEQWHFSSIARGLYRGDFRRWLRASMYRTDSTFELYRVPEGSNH